MRKTLLIFSLLLTQYISVLGQSQQDSLVVVNLDWKKTALEQGVTHYHAQVASLYKGAQNINIIEIDIKERPDLTADIVASSKMERTSVMAKNNKAIAALNGTFYNMKLGNSVCYYKQDGVIVDTTSIDVCHRFGGVIIIKNGKLKLAPWSKDEELKNIKSGGKETILASGPMMIHNGEYLPIEHNDFNRTKHPRTAIAITKDDKLLLITVDGRNKEKAIGVSINELAQLLKLLNVEEGLNLDGGGSTTLWSDKGNEDGILNMPSDKAGERRVANIIVIKK